MPNLGSPCRSVGTPALELEGCIEKQKEMIEKLKARLERVESKLAQALKELKAEQKVLPHHYTHVQACLCGMLGMTPHPAASPLAVSQRCADCAHDEVHACCQSTVHASVISRQASTQLLHGVTCSVMALFSSMEFGAVGQLSALANTQHALQSSSKLGAELEQSQATVKPYKAKLEVGLARAECCVYRSKI